MYLEQGHIGARGGGLQVLRNAPCSLLFLPNRKIFRVKNNSPIMLSGPHSPLPYPARLLPIASIQGLCLCSFSRMPCFDLREVEEIASWMWLVRGENTRVCRSGDPAGVVAADGSRFEQAKYRSASTVLWMMGLCCRANSPCCCNQACSCLVQLQR